MNHSLRRAAYAILGAFVLLAAAFVYIQVIQGPTYRDDPRNARVAAARTGRERGPILSADQRVLAISTPSRDDPKLFERTYPGGDLYAHTVGYTSALFGSRGLESEWSGELVSDRDATISGVLNGLLGGDTRPRGIRLTLEDRLQEIAADALGEQKGSVVALDPTTGAVLAMVSYPSFDPNALVSSGAAEAGIALEADPEEPLRNRAIDETYAPGSVFKVITAASGLDFGLVSPSSEFPDPVELELPGSDSTISNANDKVCNDGISVTLEIGFIRSCNTVFGQLGMDVGGDDLGFTADRFGFNRPIPFDLGVLVSFFPPEGSIEDNPPATAQNAIGQRDVQTTPLLMALAASAVANNGTIMEPYLVHDVFTSDGSVEQTTQPVAWKRAMSPATASVLADLMEQVVITGTGRKAAVPGVRIAGKTGTAQVTGKSPHAWFLGFGPVSPEPGERSIA
ncbi:MAG: penicillin-binding protein 2, partial [Actinomycetia bacterium]|nr:penicillin-binding protein 2 [Actinomycetes bacterium]